MLNAGKTLHSGIFIDGFSTPVRLDQKQKREARLIFYVQKGILIEFLSSKVAPIKAFFVNRNSS